MTKINPAHSVCHPGVLPIHLPVSDYLTMCQRSKKGTKEGKKERKKQKKREKVSANP